MEIPQQHLVSCSNHIVVPYIFNLAKIQELISSVAPRQIHSNCSFVVDIGQLAHPGDILSDEMGSWKQTDTSKKNYTLKKDQNDMVKSIQCTKPNTVNAITVTRRTYINKSDTSLHKVLVSIDFPTSTHHLVLCVIPF